MNLIKLIKIIKSKVNVIDKNFKCARCGHCCGYNLLLTKEDIGRLNTNGYSNFTDGKTMNHTEGHCIFMNKDKNFANCKIHSIKPEICNEFPMFRKDLCIQYKPAI